MANKRLYQIAKELNISHNEIIKFLESNEINVTNHMMPVDNIIYDSIMLEFSKEKKQVERQSPKGFNLLAYKLNKAFKTPMPYLAFLGIGIWLFVYFLLINIRF